ncbi:helix-turn-helix domain-containing protein [Paenibacillus sp. VT-400]|uniref:helix-turn-helix domain-containing protein n=1 Tax=Paenibacillus sp. VT-400 TaxID=1495853 RepID=UPI00069DDEDB|nr:helix-turn-helix domain-containing protein [Paenibacillus sp. VT-400]
MVHKEPVILSKERECIYQDSGNRGHIQIPNMVISCLDLSDTSKIAYGVISKYVCENGREAFPAVSRIAMACNCTKKTVIKYIKELCDKKFILKDRNGNRKTNTYYLMSIDKIEHLHVSEMFWRAVNEVYKNVEACLYEEVYNSFIKMLENIVAEGIVFREIPVNVETEGYIRETLLKGILKNADGMYKPLDLEKVKPKTFDQPMMKNTTDKFLNGTIKIHETILMDTNRFVLPDDVEKWNMDNFVQYFYEQFINATGRTHESTRSKHRGMFRRIVDKTNNDKILVKKRIQAFFQIGYDNQSLEWFCTSGRAVEIDLFITQGKRPFYIITKEKKSTTETQLQIKSGMTADDFLKRIKGGKK